MRWRCDSGNSGAKTGVREQEKGDQRGRSRLPLISRTPQSEDNPRTEVFDGKASTIHGRDQARGGAVVEAGRSTCRGGGRELGIPRNRLYKGAQDAETKGEQAFKGSGRPKASQDELSENRGQSGISHSLLRNPTLTPVFTPGM